MAFEQVNWPPEHSEALRDCHAKGMSYAQIAKTLNARFATSYTRNAALGRATRLGLRSADPKWAVKAHVEQLALKRMNQANSPKTRVSDRELVSAIAAGSRPAKPPHLTLEPVKLRCVDVSPRHLSLVELEANSCRYPYGGDRDDEPITFCGHPRRQGSSYCVPHFHLSRASDVPTERTVSTAPLRLVETTTISQQPRRPTVMTQSRRKKPYDPAKVHDRRSQDLPRNAQVAAIEVDDPLALEPGDKIVTLRSIRNDPLARLHTHRQIDEAQYQAGRAFQGDWEKAERGPSAVDTTRDYVDGGRMREPITEAQRKAILRLNRCERELGADGSALIHDVLIQGMTMDQVGERRGLRGQRWNDYFSRRLRESLDRLAITYGFSTVAPAGHVRRTPR